MLIKVFIKIQTELVKLVCIPGNVITNSYTLLSFSKLCYYLRIIPLGT